jgi:hypothetical protein
MRTTVGFPILVIASLLAYAVSANEPAKGDLPAECSLPTTLAFAEGIKSLLSRSEESGQNPRELWSKDATFRKWAASPKSTLFEIERYLRCSPKASPSQVELATLTLECLDFDAYLDCLKRLSRVAKSDAGEWALYYAVAPGFLHWSMRLASNYTAAKVKSTLKVVENAPNATPALQRMIIEILDGSTKQAIGKNPVKPFLTCGAGASK